MDVDRSGRKAASVIFMCLAAFVGEAAAAWPALPANPTLAALQAQGAGTSNADRCQTPFGSPPAKLYPQPPSDCSDIPGAETLNWTDAAGTPRMACLVTPRAASTRNRLPMIVYLHASEAAARSVMLTGLPDLVDSANLNGDPARPGFILLVPAGRNTAHQYPAPDDVGTGWDHWYRNLDRRWPGLNPDAAAIDYFIQAVKSRGIVDPRRVYLSGWSNGGAFAELYALNTRCVAAAAVYSAPDPYTDIADPCWQTPMVTQATPIYDLHNACDIWSTCWTASAFHEDLAQAWPQVRQKHVIVDEDDNEVSQCAVLCPSQTGVANHVVWPQSRLPDMLSWLRLHPLPKSQNCTQ